MSDTTPKKKTHKEWRKEVKKLRRKRIRQKLAEERNKTAAEEEATRLKDPEYQSWLQKQEELEAAQHEQEELERQEQEELWMRRELLAEKKFREQKRKYEATAAVKEAERLRIQKEFEELQQKAQKRREERKQREDQAKLDHERMLERIAEYIEVGGSIPDELKSNVQSNPNKQLCPFFSKTNACRYGMHCCRNHIRPKLSRILFFPNFFTHIKLDQSKDTEYGSDINLECTDSELHDDYVEFFEDVVTELKKFGKIDNFRTCMNSQPHLRGNLLVEYSNERDALKAYMQLQGRFYASRQINVEFSPIVTWKSAICGLSYTKRCPKGRDCNFLHIFRNPGNVYNISIFRQEESKKTNRRGTKENSVMSWNDGDDRSSKRNWRWSESPEPEDDRRSTDVNSRNKKESGWSRSDKKRTSERKHKCDEKYNRSRSKERKSSYSSRDSHRNGNSSSRRKERKRSKSKTHKSSNKRHEDSHRKKKDKKRKNKSSRSHS